jgi:hypothetical protein
MSAIQNERVLRALRRGDVRPTDFLLPDVIDGGKPITRLGARIKDLRDQNFGIETLEVRPTARYRLVSEPQTSASPLDAPPASAETSTGAGTGHPAPVAHPGIDLERDGFGPAWADSRNPMAGNAIDDTDDGDDWWLAA